MLRKRYFATGSYTNHNGQERTFWVIVRIWFFQSPAKAALRIAREKEIHGHTVMFTQFNRV